MIKKNIRLVNGIMILLQELFCFLLFLIPVFISRVGDINCVKIIIYSVESLFVCFSIRHLSIDNKKYYV